MPLLKTDTDIYRSTESVTLHRRLHTWKKQLS